MPETTKKDRLLVIGAGMASGRMLEHLTEADPERFDITLINAEPRGSYNRIMLSPVLSGDKTLAEIITHDADWYAARGIACHFGTRVSRIDRDARLVQTDNGETHAYDKLILATGSTPFIIPLPGHDLDGVIAYRDVEDTARMMGLGAGQRAVVIGGGLLGLEAAAGMAARGAQVTVVHLMDHLMERQLDPEAGAMLAKSLNAKGIELQLGAQSKEILGEDGRVTGLALEDGTILPCDLLVMAVGIRPNLALGKDAGLKAERGILVDDQMRTSDDNILAIGECVEHRGAVFGLVAPLFEQAKVAAKTLLGQPATFTQKPLATKLKVTGCDLFSAGDFADGPGREEIVLRRPGIYRRLVLEGDHLVGAVLYGDTGDGPWFFDLIQEKTSVADFRDLVIFGQAAAGEGPEGGPPDPLSAVAASPLERRCNGLTRPEAPAPETPAMTFSAMPPPCAPKSGAPL